MKSTPRNLTHTLHKSTSYEASPTILQKWKQIEVDRQCIKVTSKGTVTSPITEDLSLKLSPVEEQDSRLCSCAVGKDSSPDHQCICDSSATERKDKPVICNKRRLVFDQCNKEEGTQPTSAHIRLTSQTIADTLSAKRRSRCEELSEPTEMCEAMLDKHARHSNQGTKDPENFVNEPTTRSCVLNRPTSRRGKKRSQKTKHVEDTLQTKMSRTGAYDRLDDMIVQRMNQEKEDRELALKLQRQFDRGCQKVDRHKMSCNKYELRSWATNDGMIGHNTRRSGRISKRNEHFNYSC